MTTRLAYIKWRQTGENALADVFLESTVGNSKQIRGGSTIGTFALEEKPVVFTEAEIRYLATLKEKTSFSEGGRKMMRSSLKELDRLNKARPALKAA